MSDRHGDLSRRPATEADISFLVQLRRDTMDEHLRASGVVLSDEDQLARVLSRFDCAQIVTIDGDPVGMVKLVRDVAPWPWRLQQIQVLPGRQGRGLGSELVRAAIVEARDAGAFLELDVLKVNRVRRLYERLGFVVVAESGDECTMRWVGVSE